MDLYNVERVVEIPKMQKELWSVCVCVSLYGCVYSITNTCAHALVCVYVCTRAPLQVRCTKTDVSPAGYCSSSKIISSGSLPQSWNIHAAYFYLHYTRVPLTIPCIYRPFSFHHMSCSHILSNNELYFVSFVTKLWKTFPLILQVRAHVYMFQNLKKSYDI